MTCFEVAKQLNKIAPKIPVNVVADQPVPGNFYRGPGTNTRSIADCSLLKNLRNVCIIIGAYTGAIQTDSRRETVSLIHRSFFSQIVPKLPHNTRRDLIIIPRQSHHQDRANAPTGKEHMHMKIASYLAHDELIEDGATARKTWEAMAMYRQSSQLVIPPKNNCC